jgi:hypothetical protein
MPKVQNWADIILKIRQDKFKSTIFWVLMLRISEKSIDVLEEPLSPTSRSKSKTSKNQQAQSDSVCCLLLACLLTLKINDYSFIILATFIILTETSEKRKC